MDFEKDLHKKIWDKVFERFRYNLPTTLEWFWAYNPDLDLQTPTAMLIKGRAHEVLKFVESDRFTGK